MGNNVSEQKPNLNGYTFLQTKHDANFGELQLFTKNEGQTVTAIAKRSFKNEKDVAKLLKNRPQHQAMINVIEVWDTNQKDLCSVINLLQFEIDYYQNSLLQEIENRKKLGNMQNAFSESELYYIIYTLCDVLKFLLDLNHPFYDLHPSKILLTPQRKIKIVDYMLELDPLTNLMKVQLGQRDFEYLSPFQVQRLNQLRKKANGVETQTQAVDQEKANIFCLGLMIVVIISECQCTQFYKPEDFLIDLKQISQKLEQACKKYNYSEFFQKLIQDLLSSDEEAMKYAEVIQKLSLLSDGKMEACLLAEDQQFNKKGESSKSSDNGYQELFYTPRSKYCDYTEIDESITRALKKSREVMAKFNQGIDQLKNPASLKISDMKGSNQDSGQKELKLDTNFNEQSFNQISPTEIDIKNTSQQLKYSGNSPSFGYQDFPFQLTKIELSPNLKTSGTKQVYNFQAEDQIHEQNELNDDQFMNSFQNILNKQQSENQSLEILNNDQENEVKNEDGDEDKDEEQEDQEEGSQEDEENEEEDNNEEQEEEEQQDENENEDEADDEEEENDEQNADDLENDQEEEENQEEDEEAEAEQQ